MERTQKRDEDVRFYMFFRQSLKKVINFHTMKW